MSEHYRRLENLYLGAPTNAYDRPAIRIGEGECEISIDARPEFHHSAHAVHGSVYFKLLDDAGFFAVNSLVPDVFVLTADFTTHLLRPVVEGRMVAKGRLIQSGARQSLGEAQLFDHRGNLIGHGVGTYVRSKIALTPEVGYGD